MHVTVYRWRYRTAIQTDEGTAHSVECIASDAEAVTVGIPAEEFEAMEAILIVKEKPVEPSWPKPLRAIKRHDQWHRPAWRNRRM